MLENVFGTPEERKLKELLRRAEVETQEVYGPLGNLALGIVTAAWDSYQDLATTLKFSVEGQPTEQQMLVFYELLYFFIHLAMRSATHELTETQVSKLQDYLGPHLSRTGVDTFFRPLPLEAKNRLAREFFEKLNNAERDYSECRALVSDNPLEQDSLLGRVAHKVTEVSGRQFNPVVVVHARIAVGKAFTNVPLDKLIRDVAMVIDRVDSETLVALANRPWS